MRKIAWQGLLCLFGTCWLISAKAQGDLRVTLNFENAPLQKVFASIQSQTKLRFVYTGEQLKGEQPVTISMNNAALSAALESCLHGLPLTYTFKDNFIILQNKPEAQVEATEVSGIVKNEKEEVVAGVTVTVKGTPNAATTDATGYYSLQRVDPGAVLVFSGANVQTEEIPLHNHKTVNAVLKNKINKLDEIQVIAYGTTTQRLNTGDVSTVRKETIEAQPVSNPLAALEGRAPGLIVTQNSGVPGSGFFVQIRGRNSIASGNNPLYVVDGVPYASSTLTSDYSSVVAGGSPLSSINPSDIESISILKDADATSIYGSRGANGVILITTRKGKSGKTKLDLNAYYGIEQVDRRLKLLNTNQYLTMRNEAFKNDGATPSLDNGDYDLLIWDTTRYTDWQKNLIGNTARVADIQLNISGGNAGTQFILGGGYHRETTVFPGDFADQKGSAHFGLTHNSTDNKFKIDFTASYLMENNQLPAIDLVTPAMTLAPDAPPVYDSAGKLNWQAGFDNPFGYTQTKYQAKTKNLISHAVFTYNILPSLQAKLALGYNNIQLSEKQLTPVSAFNPASGATSGNAIYSNGSLETWILEPQIEYQQACGPGKLNFLLGGTFEQDLNESQSTIAFGFSSDALLDNMAGAALTRVLYDRASTYRYEAFFGRLNYNIKEKYILNLTARRDGSSRFGPGRQFANFGAVGAAWIFSQEAFVKENFSWFSFGKLRASFGTTGNDQIGNYQYLSTYSPTTYPYQGAPGLLPTGLSNPDYAWETNKKFELAIELSFLKDRLLFSASYYHNTSSNQLIGYPLPLVTGFTSVQQNLPATVRNTGLEMTLSYQLARNSRFNWTISANATIPANELVSFPAINQTFYRNVYQVGKPLSIYKAFEYLNVNPALGIYQFADFKGQPTLSPVYPDDLKANKNVAATLYGGLQNSFQYKGWRLDFFLQFSKQTGWNYFKGFFTVPGMPGNQPASVMNRWQKPGDLQPFQKFSQTYDSAYYGYVINSVIYGDNTVGEASFIRLKNVSLSYSFRPATLSGLKIESFRIYLQGQNLFTISGYEGMDPENQSSTALPPLRVLTAGFQITF